jgi:membrane protein YdbS with pleckstrin-like domain
MQVWKQCYLYSFPYYLVGAVIAGLVVVCGQSMGWAVAMLILPVMYMVYTFYRICLDRLVPTTR